MDKNLTDLDFKLDDEVSPKTPKDKNKSFQEKLIAFLKMYSELVREQSR